jgi:hypothetical protein
MTAHLRIAATAAAVLLLAACGAEGPQGGPKPDGGAVGPLEPDAPGGKPISLAVPVPGAPGIVFREPEPGPDIMGEEWDLAKDADVYVVGGCDRLFKNGMSYGLGDPSIRYGNSVFVSGGDVYVAGDTHPPKLGKPPGVFLWKHGAIVPLEVEAADPNAQFMRASQVAASGGDVYVAGSLGSLAALWVNGGLQHVSNNGWACCVVLSGEDVYVGGQDYVLGTTGAIWKNGVKQTVAPPGPGARRASVESLFVSGDDVYAAVMDIIDDNIYNLKSRPLLWKNGESQELLNEGEFGAYVRTVFVEGEDVYVVGNELNKAGPMAVLWKNGVWQKLLADKPALADSLFVLNGNVYVAGRQATGAGVSIPTLWINGEAVDLRPSGFTHQAWSVFVVPKEVAPKEKENVEPAAGDRGRPAPQVPTRRTRP